MKLRTPRLLPLALTVLVGGSLLSTAVTPALAAPPKKPAKGSGTKPTGTKPAPGARDIALIEAALAITLTDAQKADITAAATTRETASVAAQTAYKSAVAAIFGLSAADLDLKIKSLAKGKRDLNSALAAVLGRALTAAELTALTDAKTMLEAALTAAADAYTTSVAATLGITATELQTKVQAYLDANHGKGGGGKGGADCKPGTGGTTTGTTGTTGTTTTGTTTTGGSTYS